MTHNQSHHFFSIIIVTWNGIHHLKNFLPSVLKTDYPRFEIIIADNASDDGTKGWLEEHAPECRIITFDANHGYCGGNNRAVPYSNGDILLFLNNDVRVEPGWLNALNRSFKDKETGIVQPKIRSHQSPDYFEYAGAAGGMIDWLGYPYCRGRLFEHVEKDNGQYDDETDIFWASGAALAVRKELFEELGGFDEEFEFHMEEIDLCWRAWRRGNRTRFQPESVVYHLGGGSLPMGSFRKVYYNYRNSLMMLTKNLKSHLISKLFLRLCLDGISGIRSLLRLKPNETFAIIRSHFAFYTRLPSMLKKRRALQIESESSEDISPPIHQKLIITEAFIRGKQTYSEIEADT